LFPPTNTVRFLPRRSRRRFFITPSHNRHGEILQRMATSVCVGTIETQSRVLLLVSLHARVSADTRNG